MFPMSEMDLLQDVMKALRTLMLLFSKGALIDPT
jgi:hypothetical protein